MHHIADQVISLIIKRPIHFMLFLLNVEIITLYPGPENPGIAFAYGYEGSSDRSIRVNPLNYFLFQPVLRNWGKQRPWYVLFCL